MKTQRTRGLLIVVGLAAFLLTACIPPPPPAPVKVEGAAAASAPVAKVNGDAAAGKSLFTAKGCIACHTAAGVPGAVGTIGPNLNGLADPIKRPQLASGDTNNPANIRIWIKDPAAKKAGTMMPNLGLSDKEADDLTSFLVTLK